MKPPAFAYHDPRSVDEAIALRAAHGFDSVFLAGGQSLMPMLAIRLAKPEVLIDVNRIDDIKQVSWDGDLLEIGAGVRQHAIETDEQVKARIPLLHTMTQFIGHVENRHRGTVGGSIAHADPSAELPLAAVTLDAELVIQGKNGTRTETATDFFTGWMSTSLDEDEMLTMVRFPASKEGSSWGFWEVSRRDGDFAMASGAAQLTLASNGTVESASIGVGGVTDHPVRAREVEQALVGREPTPDAVAEAAEAIRDAVTIPDDMHATADYRRHLATVVTARAVNGAVKRAAKGQ